LSSLRSSTNYTTSFKINSIEIIFLQEIRKVGRIPASLAAGFFYKIITEMKEGTGLYIDPLKFEVYEQEYIEAQF
jgi:hypothetical protein